MQNETSATQNFSPFLTQLLRRGYGTRNLLQNAAIESCRTDRPLPEVLELRTKRPLPPDLLRLYKKYHLFELKILYGVESLDPEIDQIPMGQINQLIDRLVPIDVCRRYRLLPLAKADLPSPLLIVAMVEPDNLEAQEDLTQLLQPQGFVIQRRVIACEDYQQLLSKYLDDWAANQKKLKLARAVEVEADLEIPVDIEEDIEGLDEDPEEGEVDLSEALRGAGDAPIVALVNKILAQALQERVSDIHIEPQEAVLRLRFRQDGVLRPAFEKPFPIKIAPAVANRLKLIAHLDITQRQRPQTGRFWRLFEGRKVDFQLSTLPSRYGETIAIQVLDSAVMQPGLAQLIAAPDTFSQVRDLLQHPTGLILVTGPAASGKTRTLYSLLAELNHPGANIATVEDPIAYRLPGITQVEPMRRQGMDFATTVQAMLRQDLDIILVGKIADRATAAMAIEAALRCQVLTAFPASDIVAAIAGLKEMGISPWALSNSLIGAINQRFVRRLCPDCRMVWKPPAAELARIGLTSRRGETFYRAQTLRPKAIQTARYNGSLCSACQGAGYRGHMGIYEVLPITEAVKSAIARDVSHDELRAIALQSGMKTLLTYGQELVSQGSTTLAELAPLLDEAAMPNVSRSAPSTASTSQRLTTLEQQVAHLTQQCQRMCGTPLAELAPQLDEAALPDSVLPTPNPMPVPERLNILEQQVVKLTQQFEMLQRQNFRRNRPI